MPCAAFTIPQPLSCTWLGTRVGARNPSHLSSHLCHQPAVLKRWPTDKRTVLSRQASPQQSQPANNCRHPNRVDHDALSSAVAQRQTERIPTLLKVLLKAPPVHSVSLSTFQSVLSVCVSVRDLRTLSIVLRLGFSYMHITSQLRLPILISPLRALATAGWWIPIHKSLDAMQAARTYVPQLAPDARLVVSLANIAVNHRAYAQSLRLFAWMKSHQFPLSPTAYSVLLKSHGRAGNVIAVKGVIKSLRSKNVTIDTILLNTAIDALIRCGDIRAGQQMLLNQTYASIIDCTSYNTVMKGFVETSQVRHAFHTATRMQAAGISPTPVTINTLISGCVSAGDWDTAWQLFERYSTNFGNEPLPFPTIPRPISPSPAIKRVLASPENMNDMDEQYDGKSDENIDAVSKLPDGEQGAMHMPRLSLKRMAEPWVIMDEKKDGETIKQLRIAMTTLLCGLAETGQSAQALALLENMRELGASPNSITYASLITTCFKYGETEQALKIFQTLARSTNGAQTDLCDLHVCNAVVKGLCSADDVTLVDEAALLVENMLHIKSEDENANNEPNGTGVKGPEREPNAPPDRSFIGEINTCELVRPTVETFNALLDGYVRLCQFESAERVLSLMHQRKIRANIISYTTVMKGYAEAGDYARAKQTFREIARRKLKHDRVALNAFVAVCVRSGDAVAAMKVIDYMERSGGGISPTAQSYTPVLNLHARLDDDENVWEVYDRMREHGVPVNDYVMGALCEHVVQAGSTIRGKECETLAQRCANLLRDGLEDAVSAKVLRRTKRRVMSLFTKKQQEKYFGGLDSAELRSVSETIFERHGWNTIDSGWRAL